MLMDVAREMLNEAALPKSLWRKMEATVVFLLNCRPSKTIGGDTSYYRQSPRGIKKSLPKFLWRKMATTAVFLLNWRPSKTIGGDTSYYRIFGKHVELFFLWTTRTRPQGTAKRILR